MCVFVYPGGKGGGEDVTFNYYFSDNQRITRDPPSSYDALPERGCPPPQPLVQEGDTPSPGVGGYLLAPGGAQRPGVRRGSRRGSAGAGRERRPRPDPALALPLPGADLLVTYNTDRDICVNPASNRAKFTVYQNNEIRWPEHR